MPTEPLTIVHVVEVFDRSDGVYIFADESDARRFERAVNADATFEYRCVRRPQTVCDSATTDALISSEVDDEALSAAAHKLLDDYQISESYYSDTGGAFFAVLWSLTDDEGAAGRFPTLEAATDWLAAGSDQPEYPRDAVFLTNLATGEKWQPHASTTISLTRIEG